MDKTKIDKMSDQQLAQMYELMQTIRESELAENDPEYDATRAAAEAAGAGGKGEDK